MVRSLWSPRMIPSQVWTVLDELSTGIVPSPVVGNVKKHGINIDDVTNIKYLFTTNKRDWFIDTLAFLRSES